MTNRQVVKVFARMQQGRSVNLLSDGRFLYSYGTVIAEWVTHDTVALNTRTYSNSTSRHQSLVRYALSCHVREYEGPPARMWYSWRDSRNFKRATPSPMSAPRPTLKVVK